MNIFSLPFITILLVSMCFCSLGLIFNSVLKVTSLGKYITFNPEDKSSRKFGHISCGWHGTCCWTRDSSSVLNTLINWAGLSTHQQIDWVTWIIKYLLQDLILFTGCFSDYRWIFKSTMSQQISLKPLSWLASNKQKSWENNQSLK